MADKSDTLQATDSVVNTMIVDTGCYPTGLGAICPITKELCSTFIENRKEILEKNGDFYFPNITDTETKK